MSWCCGWGLLGKALTEERWVEENMAQGRVANLSWSEHTLTSHCSSAPPMAGTQLSFLFLERFFRHDLQRALGPEGQASVLMFCSDSLGAQCQAWGDTVSRSILVHKIWKYESMNCNRA